MTKQVQRRRGTATQHTSFTGAEGELSVNTTNKSVHVHDNVTAGGFEAARADMDNVTSSSILTAAGITATTTELNYVDGVTSAIQTQLDGKAGTASPTFTGTLTTANLTATGTTTLAGASTSADITFGDNDKAVFGAGSDLQIYHNGSDSFIDDAGTGSLYMRSNSVVLGKYTGEVGLVATADGSVDLYYNDVKKLATTSTGIDVTGTLTSDNAALGNFVYAGESGGLYLDGGYSTRITSTSYGAANQSMLFYTGTGSGSERMRISSDGSVGIGTSSPYTLLELSSTDPILRFNDSNGGTDTKNFELRYVGTNSPDIDGLYFRTVNDANTVYSDKMVILGSGNVGIGTSSPSAPLTIQTSATTNVDIKTSATNGTAQLRFSNDARTYSLGIDNNDSFFVYDATGTSTRMRIDSSGNVGIGVVPQTGGPTWQHVQFGGTGNLVSRISDSTVDAMFASNYYVNASNVDSYITTGAAARMFFNDNTISFDQAASGTAGTAISWSEAMRIDSSGRLGIGTSSPSANLEIAQSGNNVGLLVAGGGYNYTAKFESSDAEANIIIEDSNSTNDGNMIGVATNDMYFITNASERMRLDASGNLLVGTTSTLSFGSGTTKGVVIDGASGALVASRNGDAPCYLQRSGSDGGIIVFYNDTSVVGSISVSGSSTAYNTSSDHRLKENVVELTGATDRIKQLEPKRFNFIADADTTVDGFLAHEVQSVVPEAITGTHNEVDADGNPVYQGIDQSKLVPLLVATIKELEARITALENA